MGIVSNYVVVYAVGRVCMHGAGVAETKKKCCVIGARKMYIPVLCAMRIRSARGDVASRTSLSIRVYTYSIIDASGTTYNEQATVWDSCKYDARGPSNYFLHVFLTLLVTT